jgi:hypothetical protein
VEILDQLPVDLMDLPSGVYTVGRNLQPCVYWYGHDYVPSPVEAAEIEKAAPPLYANLLRVYYIQQGVDIASDKRVRDRTLSFVIKGYPGKGTVLRRHRQVEGHQGVGRGWKRSSTPLSTPDRTISSLISSMCRRAEEYNERPYKYIGFIFAQN